MNNGKNSKDIRTNKIQDLNKVKVFECEVEEGIETPKLSIFDNEVEGYTVEYLGE